MGFVRWVWEFLNGIRRIFFAQLNELSGPTILLLAVVFGSVLFAAAMLWDNIFVFDQDQVIERTTSEEN